MSSDDELITLAMDVEHNLKELHDLMKSRVNNIHFNDLQIFIGEDHSMILSLGISMTDGKISMKISTKHLILDAFSTRQYGEDLIRSYIPRNQVY